MGRKIIATVVRHGETTLNAQRLLQGHLDIPLSDVGVAQAEALGKKLEDEKFTAAFSSDLQRAHATAKEILKKSKHPLLEITSNKKLRERSFGVHEGKPVDLLREEAAKRNLKIETFTPENGETPTEVMARAGDFFEELCRLVNETENENADENILIVSHGGWILHLMRFLSENQEKYELENFHRDKALRIPRNTAVCKFHISYGTEPNSDKLLVSFSCFNDTSHLD